jgi:small subunit ribosomal protein S7e
MDKGKKEKVTEMEKNFQNTLSSIVSSEKDNKKLLEGVKIENAREVEIEKGERCFLVCVNTADEKDLRKIHPTLVKKFEEQFSAPVALIPAKKRVNGKLYKRYRGTKVPRDRTLTAMFDSYLDDLLYPATIIGKRIRYPKGKVRQFKVLVDPIDKDAIEYKIPCITACYKALTNRPLEVEFPENKKKE